MGRNTPLLKVAHRHLAPVSARLLLPHSGGLAGTEPGGVGLGQKLELEEAPYLSTYF